MQNKKLNGKGRKIKGFKDIRGEPLEKVTLNKNSTGQLNLNKNSDDNKIKVGKAGQ